MPVSKEMSGIGKPLSHFDILLIPVHSSKLNVLRHKLHCLQWNVILSFNERKHQSSKYLRDHQHQSLAPAILGHPPKGCILLFEYHGLSSY